MGKYLKHPFGQAVLVLVVAYFLLDYGIAYMSLWLGLASDPVPIPNSVLLQYLITVSVGILLWVSDNDARWAEFKAPIHRVMVDPGLKRVRNSLMVLVPILVAFLTFSQVRPSVAAPTTLRSVHPAPPGQIIFQGINMELATLENPLRSQGSTEEHYEEGKRVYYENCLACHGDGLDGQGHYAHGFSPAPANFEDSGTIAQLTESYVFWRISKGGPDLPNEGAPWNSAMPAWENSLTEDEIWSVIIFLYEQAGHEPRTFEEEAGEGEGGVKAARMALAALFAAASALPFGALSAQDGDDLGEVTYVRWCAGCHGVDGTGNGSGAEYMLPRPRDFTLALYQIRTTASGDLPTDDDILAIIDRGMPGTTMPGWETLLSNDEKAALVRYLKSFSRFFTPDEVPEPLDFGRATRSNADVLAEGERLFREVADCAACHGDGGRGDGESSPTLEDDSEFPIRSADLTENWLFNGGGEVEDIYRRLLTGLDGTPMPSLADVITAGVITDEELWAIAHYVRSLSPEEPPGVTEVVRGVLFEDVSLPSSVDDEAWDDVERAYLPLVGQIIVMPRWFDPRVDGVWVQAAHDGESVAVRVTWSDPNNSPDPQWADWKSLVISLMQPKEGDPQDEGPTPDQLVVQFPMQMPEGMERPFFLGGDNRRPVYIWQWQSDRDGALEGEARGLGTEAFQSEGQNLTVDASHADGQWRVMFTRPLVTDDEGDLDFVTGEAIPMALFAWDGDNGESGTRGAVSSWYFLFLEDATPATVYVYPVLAMMLTAGLGFLVVGRAQKREREGGEVESETANS